MPFPTVEVGDAVVYWDGTTALPAHAASAVSGGKISLQVDANTAGPSGTPTPGYHVQAAPFDATRVTADSWSWPTNSGATSPNYRVVAGNTATVSAADGILAFSADHTRVVTLSATPAGQELTFLDVSGSVTAGNTITFTGTPTVSSSATITPGTNITCTIVSDGTNYWLIAKK